MKTLILGGARSGKSRYAEQLVLASSKQKLYIATAQALDGEMTARIAHHREQRGAGWITIEEPLALAGALQQATKPDSCILVDCLTLWLTNLLLAGDEVFEREKAALLTTLPNLPGEIVFVSNEVGWSIVPGDPLSRRFVDETGRLHQTLATVCDQVTLVVAGLPWPLKSASAPGGQQS